MFYEPETKVRFPLGTTFHSLKSISSRIHVLVVSNLFFPRKTYTHLRDLEIDNVPHGPHLKCLHVFPFLYPLPVNFSIPKGKNEYRKLQISSLNNQ